MLTVHIYIGREVLTKKNVIKMIREFILESITINGEIKPIKFLSVHVTENNKVHRIYECEVLCLDSKNLLGGSCDCIKNGHMSYTDKRIYTAPSPIF